jgi:phospholipase C
VEADKALSNTWDLRTSHGKYDLTVFGPNGFFRAFKGTASKGVPSDLDVDLLYDRDDNAVVLRVTNQARVPCRVRVTSLYGNRTLVDTLPRGRALEKRWSLKSSFGWYDLTVSTDADASFQRRFAGRLETGRDGYSDPALGGMAADCKD